MHLRLVLFLLLALTNVAHALDPTLLASQYGHTAWRLQDGDLPASAYPIAQTADGYLWIGTRMGLVRFDGVRFVPFGNLSSRQLSNQFIVSLLGAKDGTLWIGTSGGLSRWRDNTLVDYPLNGKGAFHLSEDREGRIWFVTQSTEAKPLCMIEGDQVRCHGADEGLDVPEGCCSQMMKTDGKGTFWISINTAVVRWRPGERSMTYPVEAKAKAGVPGFIAVGLDPAGPLWIGISALGPGLGLQQLAGTHWKTFVAPDIDGSTLATQVLFFDRENTLWVGTMDRGIYRIRGDEVDHFDSADGLSSDCIYWFFEDREGNLWISTSNGIDRLRDLKVASFSTRQGLSVDEVDGVIAGRDGRIWVGSALGLDVLQNGRVTESIRAARGLPGNQVTALLEDRTGKLWAGIDEGLWIYDNGRFTQVLGLDRRPLGFVFRLAQDAQGDIWAVVRTRPRKFVRIRAGKVQEEFPETQWPLAFGLAADPKGGLWIGLRSGDLAHYLNGKVETFAFHNGTDARAEQILVTMDGMVVGATRVGLVALRNGVTRTIGTKAGLPCEAVNGAIEDEQQALWLATECAMLRISRSDLDEWWEQPAGKIKARVFDLSEGMRPGRAPFDRAARTPDGRLWFANGVSLQVLDPKRIAAAEHAAPPMVRIEQLVADHKSFPLEPSPRLPALTRDLQIDYTALTLSVPHKVQFRYQLEGHDQDWTDAHTRRQAFYTDLEPGNYRFRVIAGDSDGRWNEAGASFNFSIEPTFYQTGWFAVLAAVLAAAAIWFALGWRIQQVKSRLRSRLEGRLAERERIARELHDTFLQSVQGLILKFQVAMDRIPQSQPARELMEQALQRADLVIAEGRDRVKDLRLSTNTPEDLPRALQAVCEDLARGSDIKFHLAVEGAPRVIDPVIREEVQRIAAEALTNAFRHAHATQIEAELIYARRGLTTRIVDDGRGFDTSALDGGSKPGHWGLIGMRERAVKIRGRLKISSRHQAGTAVELTVPAAIAFRATVPRRRWLTRFLALE